MEKGEGGIKVKNARLKRKSRWPLQIQEQNQSHIQQFNQSAAGEPNIV
jgi:hypothetical protein